MHDASSCFGKNGRDDESGNKPARIHLPDLNIDNYNIERILGNGTYSVVILGKHKISKIEVAIKIIDETKLNATDIELIKNEVYYSYIFIM